MLRRRPTLPAEPSAPASEAGDSPERFHNALLNRPPTAETGLEETDWQALAACAAIGGPPIVGPDGDEMRRLGAELCPDCPSFRDCARAAHRALRVGDRQYGRGVVANVMLTDCDAPLRLRSIAAGPDNPVGIY
jgi:hypothetical protein